MREIQKQMYGRRKRYLSSEVRRTDNFDEAQRICESVMGPIETMTDSNFGIMMSVLRKFYPSVMNKYWAEEKN